MADHGVLHLREGLIFESREAFHAYICPACGKVEFFVNRLPFGLAVREGGVEGEVSMYGDLIGSPGEEIACLECGKQIGPNEARCPHCGWTWK